MDTGANAIAITAISKTFGRGGQAVAALDDLSLTIPEGKVYGLLGPNGAGKSTLLRIVVGLVRQDRGSVDIFGTPAGPASRRQLGTLIESPSAYPFLTAREHLSMLARMADAPADVAEILKRIGLSHAADKKVSGFSLGMKQRLGLGCALIGRPRAVILDEPTNGLDPDGILEMRSLIHDLAHRGGLTVLLSSHLLDEVQRVCDRIAILRSGKLAAEGNVADLLDQRERFWMQVEEAQVPTLVAQLGPDATPGDDGIYIRIDRQNVPELVRSLATSGISIYEAKWIKPDLESVFLSQTRDQNR